MIEVFSQLRESEPIPSVVTVDAVGDFGVGEFGFLSHSIVNIAPHKKCADRCIGTGLPCQLRLHQRSLPIIGCRVQLRRGKPQFPFWQDESG